MLVLWLAAKGPRELLEQNSKASADMRAVAYLRASDKANPNRVEAMLDEQRESIRRWAESQDFELVATFEDRNSSANDLCRPAFRALLQLASEPTPGFVAILLYGGDRWCRDIFRSVEIAHGLKEVGVTLLTMPMEYRGRWPAPVPGVEVEAELQQFPDVASTMKTFYDDLLCLSRHAAAIAVLPRKTIAKSFRDLGLLSGVSMSRVIRLMDQVEIDFKRIGRKLRNPTHHPTAHKRE